MIKFKRQNNRAVLVASEQDYALISNQNAEFELVLPLDLKEIIAINEAIEELRQDLENKILDTLYTDDLQSQSPKAAD